MKQKSDLDLLMEKYEELYSMLCDYNVEKRFIGKIHEVIQKMIDALPEGTKIGFRPYGMPAIWLIRNFDFKHVQIVGIFDKVLSFNIAGISVYEMSSGQAQDVDVFIMTSFYSRKEIIAELEASGHSYLDVYACLEREKLKLYAPFDLYYEGGPAILHDYLMRWKQSPEDMKETTLRELLAVACEEKDFFMLEELCKEYELIYPFLKAIREKYNEFYALIQCLVEKRKQKDILVYWLDAVPYKWRGYFKELDALSKKGLNFEQAYTCTPYTDQTFRVMFSRLLPLTDWEKSLEKIGEKNSELVQYLNEKNYKVCRIGEETPIENRRCMEEGISICMEVQSTCNAVLWKTLCKMLSDDVPMFLIAHMCAETHPPVLCAELDNLWDVYSAMNPMEQFRISANYVDKRVAYYYQIMNRNQRIQIFMSDHGEHFTDQFPKWCWAQHKLHAWCFVIGNGICVKQENAIFFYQKFIDLVKWLIEPEKYDYEKCLSDYAVFQDTDIYSAEVADRFIKAGRAEQALAYRGALDGIYKYVINGIGREFFYKIIDDKDVEVEESEAIDNFRELKELAGTDFPDLSICEKYKHVSKLYVAIKRNGKTQRR